MLRLIDFVDKLCQGDYIVYSITVKLMFSLLYCMTWYNEHGIQAIPVKMSWPYQNVK